MLQKEQKFMDKQRAPRLKDAKNNKSVMEPVENTGFTAAADRITPYDPDELRKRKEL
ncbi:hypothetical protein [Thermincola ferriacetica]|uniref:hypothetical protein n=1 Tax=Thermincola ferriacetica TaxID=281456 RepID=UPI001364C76A|nr:hypothetical protein [Thermincola ferriacetica]